MPQPRKQFVNKRNTVNEYVVKESGELMAFIMQAMHGISRTKAKELLTKKCVSVNNMNVSQWNHELHKGDKVQIGHYKGHKEFHSDALKIVYEDAYLLVVEKREGVLSVSTGRQKNSAHDILDEYLKRQGRNSGVHTVHRLDRETSGLMIFAKDIKTRLTFQEAWKDYVYDRRYIAVVSGDMEKDSGTVASWLTDNRMFVSYSTPYDNGGKYAVTNYKTIKRANGYSLVELKLDTGRKNQIRVHLQDLKHPIIGDRKYGNGIDTIGRLALHAFKLCFRHPVTGVNLEFETPYPPKFKKLFEQGASQCPAPTKELKKPVFKPRHNEEDYYGEED